MKHGIGDDTYFYDSGNDGTFDGLTWQEDGGWYYSDFSEVDNQVDNNYGTPYEPPEPPIDPNTGQGEPCDYPCPNCGDCYCDGSCMSGTGEGTGDNLNSDNYQNPTPYAPTPCESAALANDVYATVNGGRGAFTFGDGWQKDTQFDLYGNQIILQDNDSGFNSAIYKRMTSSGEYEYMYVTQGTDMGDVSSEGDWVNNFMQGFGKPSPQYKISTDNAERLAKWAQREGVSLFFSGHSLGGGLASANALKTGLPAITFNAAAIHPLTKDRYGLTHDAVIEAFVVNGELLDQLNKAMGFRAEGNINDLEVSLQWLRDAFPGLAGLTDAGIRHMMGSVLKALGCDD